MVVQEKRVLFRVRGRLGNVLPVYSSLEMLLQQSSRAPGSLNIYKMPDTWPGWFPALSLPCFIIDKVAKPLFLLCCEVYIWSEIEAKAFPGTLSYLLPGSETGAPEKSHKKVTPNAFFWELFLPRFFPFCKMRTNPEFPLNPGNYNAHTVIRCQWVTQTQNLWVPK